MEGRSRRAPHLLLGLALAAAWPARAGVTGSVDLQSQILQNSARLPGGGAQGTTTALLLEALSLHYAGLPFGPALAVATAGGSFSAVNAWYGGGLQASGQVLSFDASLGFLPRRAVPLRLYAGGSLPSGTGGQLATGGVGPSFLYGGSVNVEPGRLTPGLRLDASESRNSRPGLPRLSDAQRRLVVAAYETVARQSLNLTLRLDGDHREGVGDIRSRSATLLWTSALHQTTVLASEVHRSLAILGGITSDRQASAASEQRWSSSLATQVGGRLSEASASSALGRLGEAQAGVTWRPSLTGNPLTFSGGASAGFTRTRAPAAEASGSTFGANARAAYARPLGPLTGALAAGAATSSCSCRYGNEGRSTLLDAALSLALLPAARGSAQADYTVARAFAPLSRGGDRLENHARTYGRLAIAGLTELSAALAWDDGRRELLDITSGRAASLHERALSGSLAVATRFGRVTPSAEVRHARNAVASDGTLFVAGSPTVARSVTSALAGALWTPLDSVELQGRVLGAWTDLRGGPDLRSLGANLSLGWRIGRLAASAQYQAAHTRQGDAPSTFQQSIRVALSRPFEL